MKNLLMLSAAVVMITGTAMLLALGDRGEPGRIADDHVVINEHDTGLRGPCYLLDYWQNATYYWLVPDPTYGDMAFAQRFTVCRPETLTSVGIQIYDDGSGLCGDDSVYCTIYDDDGTGLPGTMLARVGIPGGTYQFSPAWTAFDFSAYNLIPDCEFHVAFSSGAISGSDYECCLSDDGSKPLNRSSILLSTGVWVPLTSIYATDVNFVFTLNICPPDDFEGDHKMHYPQYPDEAGWDVFATDPLVLADDWLCTETGNIEDIHFWGSWRGDTVGEIDSFLLSIHRDIPAFVPAGTCYNWGDCNRDGVNLTVADLVDLSRYLNAYGSPAPFYPRYDFDGNCIIDNNDVAVFENYFVIGLPAFDPYGGYPIPTCCRARPYSRPGDLLWQKTITDFNEIRTIGEVIEGWYAPDADSLLNDNHWLYYRYDVCLPESLWFWQEKDSVYWLNISAFVHESGSAFWGWKSSYNQWNDDAVWTYNGEDDWQEMYEPGEYYYVPGDVDDDGDVDIPDLTYLQDYIFSGGPPPPYEIDGFYPAADVTGDCLVDMADIVHLQDFLAGGLPPVPCPLYPTNCGHGSFGAEFDPGGNLGSWWGTNYYGSGWYFYPETDWYNIWFYDHPLDTTRKKTMAITVNFYRMDTLLPASVMFAVNWSTELWETPPGDSMPPLPGEDEDIFIGRDILFEGEIADSLRLEFEYVLPDFNPEWVSIDVIASNVRIFGGIKHCCAKSMDLAFVITNSRCSAPCDCLPGDANGSGNYNILDITYLIDYLYPPPPNPAPTPYPLCSGDANCDCVVNILDITYLIAYLYQGGQPPCDCPTWLQICGPPLRK